MTTPDPWRAPLGPAADELVLVHAFPVPFEGLVTPGVSPRETGEYRKSFREKAVAGARALIEGYERLGIRWKTVIRPGDARTVVLGEVRRGRVDLLALGTHGRTGVRHTLVGSVAAWVIAAAPCDVLVARPIRFSFDLP